jgi:RHS repeat-associated protein
MSKTGLTETSRYDGAGRLCYRSDGSQTNRFVYTGDEEIEEQWNGGATQTERMGGAEAELRVDYTSGRVFEYALMDPFGSVGLRTDNSGTITGIESADAYGTNPSSTNERNWLGDWGYRYRSDAQVYQVGARVYDPAMGRFLQQDPLSLGEGDYTYAGNNPINFVDPR